MDGSVERALHAPHRESVAHAPRTRRAADRLLTHPVFADDRPAYERAVRALEKELRRFGSVGDLVGYDAVGWPTLHVAVRDACSGPDGSRLLTSIVEGAAFWRRVRELVAEAAA